MPAPYAIDDQRGYVALDLCDVLDTEEASIRFAFPHINDVRHCTGCKILATTNEAVDSFNNLALDELTQTYRLPEYFRLSADSLDVDGDDNAIEAHITCEFLNMQQEHGVPPHKLRLVPGALYELMRNFSPDDRLMNHTPVILREVHKQHVLIETLDSRRFPLPRICFRWALARGTTTMVRRQLPLRPGYASTYNGSQGATLTRCVVDVRRSPFSHGHLYVALGRVPSRQAVRVLASPARLSPAGRALTKNVVWKELLLEETTTPSRMTSSSRKRPASSS